MKILLVLLILLDLQLQDEMDCLLNLYELHCHQIRHGSASHWLDDGLNIVQISRLLGHSDITTTMVYLDISEEMKAKALAKIADCSITTIPKEWKQDKSLASICGIKPIKERK
jgi:hypothetical protein